MKDSTGSTPPKKNQKNKQEKKKQKNLERLYIAFKIKCVWGYAFLFVLCLFLAAPAAQ